MRTGVRARLLDDLDCCGYLCAMTGRCAEAVTVWAAVVVLQGTRGLQLLQLERVLASVRTFETVKLNV